jgi:hypothetical protein
MQRIPLICAAHELARVFLSIPLGVHGEFHQWGRFEGNFQERLHGQEIHCRRIAQLEAQKKSLQARLSEPTAVTSDSQHKAPGFAGGHLLQCPPK